MSMYKGRKVVFMVLAILIVISCTSWPAFAENVIVPVLSTDMQKYIQNDTVPLTLKLTGIQAGDKTDSVAFEIQYDANTFDLMNNNVDSAVVNGYIPFKTKLNLGKDSAKRVHIAYMDPKEDTVLQEGKKVFTINFRVKSGATPGTKTFTLKPVDMLDSGSKVYNVNNYNQVTYSVQVTNDAVIQGKACIYLGDAGSDLNNGTLRDLNQAQLNETFKNLQFTLKHAGQTTGTVFKGSDIFIPDENGNLAVKNADNQVRGNFRVYTSDTANTSLTVDGVGYLAESVTVALNTGTVSALDNDVLMYPGDLGHIEARTLVLSPDGKVNNVDFSAWLQIYTASEQSVANAADILRADFTKDGHVDCSDFSLWMESYRKLLEMEQ